MGFILYQKLTGKRRRRRSAEEEHFDPWDLLDNIQTIALHGNYIYIHKHQARAQRINMGMWHLNFFLS